MRQDTDPRTKRSVRGSDVARVQLPSNGSPVPVLSIADLREQFKGLNTIKVHTKPKELRITIPYDEEMNARLRALGPVWWDKAKKVWRAKLSVWPQLLELATDLEALDAAETAALYNSAVDLGEDDIRWTVAVRDVSEWTVGDLVEHEGTHYEVRRIGKPYRRDDEMLVDIGGIFA